MLRYAKGKPLAPEVGEYQSSAIFALLTEHEDSRMLPASSAPRAAVLLRPLDPPSVAVEWSECDRQSKPLGMKLTVFVTGSG
jgi:hypothetical protein